MEEAIRILVVDDEPDIRRICRILLETGGYTVLEAATGAEAVEQVRQHPERAGKRPAAGAVGVGVFHSPLAGGEPGPRRAGAHDL